MAAVTMNRKITIRVIGMGICTLVAVYLMYRLMLGPSELSQVSLQNPAEAQLMAHQGRNYKAKPIDKDAPKTRNGLSYKAGKFHLDGKNIKIISGAMHYFRVHPDYWEDRLKKMKACGLNTVETYVPWNMHEEIRGEFNFEDWLDIRRYVELAKKVGLLVIIRPGPYICAEWEWGGLPSWLLHETTMKVRTLHKPYMDAAEAYLGKIIGQVVDLQYTKGGPIIAWQVENEYGAFGDSHEYLTKLRDVMQEKGVLEMMFLSDGLDINTLEKAHVLHIPTLVNFKEWKYGKDMFDWSKKAQPDVPLMVGEFWTGWFDHWTEKHHTDETKIFEDNVMEIFKAGAQGINFYMFHGGTNFGFWNGANGEAATNTYKPTITSYDYDAPLNEYGHPTDKCFKTREIAQEFYPEGGDYSKKTFDVQLKPKAYGDVKVTKMMSFTEMLKLAQVTVTHDKGVLPMELLDINNHGGQGYGFTLYRTNIKKGRVVKFTKSVRDRALMFLNGHPMGVFDWTSVNKEFNIETVNIKLQDTNELTVLVENLGRVNYFRYQDMSINEQRKGLVDDVELDGEVIKKWQMTPLEFKKPFMQSLSKSTSWTPYAPVKTTNIPVVCRVELTISEAQPQDTFIDMKDWNKGVVFVNNFNIGRYWNVGPQRTLYIPGPLLMQGKNEIIVFELHKPHDKVTFTADPVLG